MHINNENRLLAERYTLIKKIGGGGMATVYKATDNVLQRTVAIKLLRHEFLDDEEFVNNFKMEARSAASLSHPNIVSIFDVGKDGEEQFIVMEYIDGKTLKQLIKEEAPFIFSKAIKITEQVARALEHAHKNQIIHRDIKPHNIMIDQQGNVKVTDFGIARAVTSSTITYKAESVLGSVHYFSPEQARGSVATETSDIYSLGIVLYEMITGKLPFSGDNPVGVAMMHIQDRVEEPSFINKNVPENLDKIVLKSLSKNQIYRYQSAKELSEDLAVALDDKYEIITNDEDAESEQATRLVPTVKSKNNMYNNHKYYDKQSNYDGYEGDGKVGILEHPAFRFTIILMFIGVIIYAGFFVYNTVMDILHVPDLEVPAVEGELLSDALIKYRDAGFEIVNIQEEHRHNDNVEYGHIYRQEPSAGSIVKYNYSPLVLYVSLGKEGALMPELIGVSTARAKLVLDQLGVNYEVIEEHREDVSDGQVYGQVPEANTSLEDYDAAFIIYVSKGIETFEMPDLIGLTLDEAEKKLEELKLIRGTIQRESSYEIENNIVINQAPFEAGDEVSEEEVIELWVSSGYPSDARFYEETIAVEPLIAGSASEVIIKINDARGRGIMLYERTIYNEELFQVQIVLSPGMVGVIEVYVDDVFIDSRAVTY